MISAEAYINALSDRLAAHANSDNAGQMERYMKNRFPFFGIKAPERKALVRAHHMEHGIPLDWQEVGVGLWEQDHREMQYAFNDMLEPRIRKQTPDLLPTIETLIQSRSWWDTVDFLAPRLAGRVLEVHREAMSAYPDKWIEHDNFWLQRSAIIVQLNWKSNTDEDRLYSYIRKRADSPEFFVRKAAGWALRQYARVAPESVQRFVADTRLHPLTVREALKHIGSLDDG